MKPTHDSIRGWFAAALHDEMQMNHNIVLITGDLGYGMLDKIREDFQDRFYNVGASEQAMIGIAVGMAMAGKIPFCYSITPFLIYRPFEWIRNYLNHELHSVKLVGSGVNDDYKHDGQSHHAFEIREIMAGFHGIESYFPDQKEQIPNIVSSMSNSKYPGFLALRR